MEKIEVKSENVRYTDDHIEARYTYETTEVTEEEKGKLVVTPKEMTYNFRTERRVPKLGMMLVGWGGNNGSTVTAAVLANKLNINWNTKDGVKVPNYYGSLTQASTVLLGCDPKTGEGVYVPLKDLLPMVDPNDIEFDGWDVSSSNLAESMERARVLDYNLQAKLKPHMEKLKPRPSIYYPDFIAANQADRADNVIPGDSKWDHVEKIREDIQDFKETKKLDKVIVLWTANTERFCDVRDGLNDTAENLLKSIKNNDEEVSQSTVFAVASILEGVTYINGSPQNTFVPGVVELAQQHRVFIGGDDFKSGQTKVKSVLVDFLVSSGIKPTSIVSYNHLGNNDGRNLSAPQQFKSKEVTKSSVIDDMVESNQVLYKPGEVPDHCIVIKYVPYVGDSKRAMDEYTSELMMGGLSTIAMHNTCEDSLLAAPIILDLVILAEVCQRISFRTDKEPKYQQFNSVLSILSYLVKAPIVPDGTPLVNALFRQRACIENVLRACIGLAPINHMLLEYKHEDVHTRSRVANGNVVAKENGVKENGVKENGVKEEGKDEEGKEEEEGKVEGVVASTLAAGKNAMKAMWVTNGNVMAKENGVKENGVENGVKENGVKEEGKDEEGKDEEEEGKVEGVVASTLAAGKNAMKAMWNGLHGDGFHGGELHGDELRVNGFDPLLDGP